MINPAIETDLVGELVQIDEFSSWGARDDEARPVRTVACGRIRAVTAGPEGAMVLWIEIVNQDDIVYCRFGNGAVGDLVVEHVEADGGRKRIRLIRSKG